MAKDKNYEYHKQNDYPGERVAEQKRVAEREAVADERVAAKGRADEIKADNRVAEKGRTDNLRADARVAEKGRIDELRADGRVARRGRMDDELMDSEIERSTARAKGVNRSRNAADMIGIFIVAGVVIILLAGLVWSYTTNRAQANEINALNAKIANGNVQIAPASLSQGNVQPNNAAQLSGNLLSNTKGQIQLYNDFLALTANTNAEVNNLEQLDGGSVSMYQLCSDYMERANDINLAMNNFAEKEVIYFRQVAVLENRPQCNYLIDRMNERVVSSETADQQLYFQNLHQCNRLLSTPIDAGTQLKTDLMNVMNDATAKTNAFTAAESNVNSCLA